MNGVIYGNLDCPSGYTCGDESECLTPVTYPLSYLISQSTTPLQGNFTNASYKNNGQVISGLTYGIGVGYCFNTSELQPPVRMLNISNMHG